MRMAFDQYEKPSQPEEPGDGDWSNRSAMFSACSPVGRPSPRPSPTPKNLALFLPFADTKVPQTAARSGKRFSRNEPMFVGAHAASGNFRQHEANAGKCPENPLLTGGLLVRIQRAVPKRFESIAYEP
jgi:hypothetical protein